MSEIHQKTFEDHYYESERLNMEARKELSQARKLIAELIKAAEDFELRENHAEWCLIKKQYGGGCNCMDTKAYSLHECSARIRTVLSNNKDLIEKLTKE